MKGPIRVLVAIERGVSREAVRTALAPGTGVEVVGLLEGLEEHLPTLHETAADLTVLACRDDGHGAIPFIGEAVAHRPERPLVVLCDGSPNGFIRRAFEAGADDILTVPLAGGPVPETASREVGFALEKAIARRNIAASTGVDLGSLICVLGPKGGIGKTLTSTNLAAALADAGHRVVIVDLDLQFGDVGLALGLPPDRTIYDLATSSGTLDAEKVEAFLIRHESGARALLGPRRPDQAAAVTVDFLRALYPVLRHSNDFVVIDTPPGFTPEVITSIDSSSDVCVVGTLDSLSLKNTRLGLETLELMGYDRGRVKVVLNRADSRVGVTLNDVQAIVGRRPDAFIPSHRDITRATNEGQVIVLADRRSVPAHAFAHLASLYTARQSGAASNGALPSTPPKRRWFHRKAS